MNKLTRLMHTQEPTWREKAWIRLRHLWWFFFVQGILLVVRLKWGLTAPVILLSCVAWIFFCLHLAWLHAKGVGFTASKFWARILVAIAIPFALISGFVGFICIRNFFFGN